LTILTVNDLVIKLFYLVCMMRFWNNLNLVCTTPKDWKPHLWCNG